MSVTTLTPPPAVARILAEGPITLADARDDLAECGYRVDRATAYRWALRGVKGTKLETIRIGDRILTSRPAIRRFIEARSRIE